MSVQTFATGDVLTTRRATSHGAERALSALRTMRGVDSRNELIPLTTNDDGVTAVSGRALHEFLEVKDRYNDWMPRMIKYGFVAGQDFTEFSVQSPKARGGMMKDHVLTLDMAKELSMIQRTDKGKQARQYFIECEKRLKSTPQFEIPATYAAALRLAADQTERAELAENNLVALEAAREQDKPKIESFEALMNSDGLYTIGNAAKILHTGQNRLFKLLRDNDVLIQNGHRKNTPYQYFMNQEYFSVKTDVYQSRRTGISHENHQTFVTPRGLDWLRKKITEWT